MLETKTKKEFISALQNELNSFINEVTSPAYTNASAEIDFNSFVKEYEVDLQVYCYKTGRVLGLNNYDAIAYAIDIKAGLDSLSILDKIMRGASGVAGVLNDTTPERLQICAESHPLEYVMFGLSQFMRNIHVSAFPNPMIKTTYESVQAEQVARGRMAQALGSLREQLEQHASQEQLLKLVYWLMRYLPISSEFRLVPKGKELKILAKVLRSDAPKLTPELIDTLINEFSTALVSAAQKSSIGKYSVDNLRKLQERQRGRSLYGSALAIARVTTLRERRDGTTLAQRMLADDVFDTLDQLLYPTEHKAKQAPLHMRLMSDQELNTQARSALKSKRSEIEKQSAKSVKTGIKINPKVLARMNKKS